MLSILPPYSDLGIVYGVLEKHKGKVIVKNKVILFFCN